MEPSDWPIRICPPTCKLSSTTRGLTPATFRAISVKTKPVFLASLRQPLLPQALSSKSAAIKAVLPSCWPNCRSLWPRPGRLHRPAQFPGAVRPESRSGRVFLPGFSEFHPLRGPRISCRDPRLSIRTGRRFMDAPHPPPLDRWRSYLLGREDRPRRIPSLSRSLWFRRFPRCSERFRRSHPRLRRRHPHLRPLRRGRIRALDCLDSVSP